MTQIAVAVMNGVLDSSLGISLDIFNTARVLSPDPGSGALQIDVACLSGSGSVRTSAGLQIGGLTPVSRLRQPDVVVLPGCNVSNPALLQGWLSSQEFGDAVAWVAEVAPRARIVAAGCVGSFVLASAGLLDDRAATTTWWLTREFQSHFPQVHLDMHRMVVDEGHCVTAGAALAQADLSLHLVRRIQGVSAARTVSSFVLADERAKQTTFAISSRMARQHPEISKAEKWIRSNLARPFALPELAQALHVSTRTLSRRFFEALGSTPSDFIQRVRAEEANLLLQNSNLPLQEIAERVGYQDVGALRRVLRRLNYPTPSSCRRGAQTH
jgi:transcriptional regulator GlxA family with amidase domain